MVATRTLHRSRFVIFAGLVVLAACNGDDTTSDTTIAPTEVTSTTTAEPAPDTTTSSTTPSVSSTAPASTPTTTPPADPTTTSPTSTTPDDTTDDTTPATPSTTAEPTDVTGADVTGAETAWTELITTTADPNADTSDIDQVATEAMVDQMTTFFRLAGPDGVDVSTFPSATVNADGTVTIEDCVWHTPDVSDDPSFHFTATAQPTDTGYQITNIAPQGPGCVPKELAEPALAAYAEFRELTVELGRNPDPDDPRLPELATGATLEASKAFYADLLVNGNTLWLDGDSNPYPFEFTGPTTVIIDDCVLPNPGYGVHDSTGAPTGVLAVEPGKQVVETVDLMLTDTGWRASDGGIIPDFECDPRNPQALVVVGA